MAAPRGTKRKSDDSPSADDQAENVNMTEHMMATRAGSPSMYQEGPRKRQRTGITSGQKQALIDNLQLEITDRARKLRAQYNLQAQGLRTRIEIRVNRIPMALRNVRMGELADQYMNGQHPQLSKPTPSARSTSYSRPPPVPEKDTPVARQTSQTSSHTTTSSKRGPGRPPKQTRFGNLRPSGIRTRTNVIPSDRGLGTEKENRGGEMGPEQPQTKQRDHHNQEAGPAKAPRILSPASPNVRSLPRTTPGGKPLRARPGARSVAGTPSPVKQHSASNIFSNLAEKARSTTRPGPSPRKQTASTSTTASSAGGSVRGRKAATATGTGTAKGAVATKTTRRFSGISESSDGSTAAAVKKGTARGATGAGDKEMPPPSPTKRSVMGTIRKGVTGAGAATKKAAAAKTAAPASAATGRVLRKRT
ncbi:hypothetical protein VPNG_01872 [Cytospora leucostoma]|uniref:Borealin N-terminal domain-containing protein n=1 Tax=Cytospora leucostoma TaxID=1230097 RepID=A0A423XIQ2_9PEZI|nr:hypothetical protein VPNG_01872 [Cytospora leucostoma]